MARRKPNSSKSVSQKLVAGSNSTSRPNGKRMKETAACKTPRKQKSKKSQSQRSRAEDVPVARVRNIAKPSGKWSRKQIPRADSDQMSAEDDEDPRSSEDSNQESADEDDDDARLRLIALEKEKAKIERRAIANDKRMNELEIEELRQRLKRKSSDTGIASQVRRKRTKKDTSPDSLHDSEDSSARSSAPRRKRKKNNSRPRSSSEHSISE
jgi:hypothetical protein